MSRIKTINDDKIRLQESEIAFFKKTLLERETEIASLRLYLAKLVRVSNHLITENELDSIPSLTRSSDSLSKKVFFFLNSKSLSNHFNLNLIISILLRIIIMKNVWPISLQLCQEIR